ncbi:hypothetical protein EDB80DRAFT_873268 [Ilyonectria destructans]|nr:hypothetical protein EDB80DRAFT_873268 [Ilyonectria destructans]
MLMPVGAIGELIVEGSIIARGCFNRPDLTPSLTWGKDFPLAPPLRRFCNTGHLCQHPGHKDPRVKIGGQRAELEEVERNVKKCFARVHQVRVVFIPANASFLGGVSGLIAFVCGPNGDESLAPISPGGPVAIYMGSFPHATHTAQEELRETIPGSMVNVYSCGQCLTTVLNNLTKTQRDRHKTPRRGGKVSFRGSDTGIGRYNQMRQRCLESYTEKQLQRTWADVSGHVKLNQVVHMFPPTNLQRIWLTPSLEAYEL